MPRTNRFDRLFLADSKQGLSRYDIDPSTTTGIPEIQITIDVPRGQVSQIMGLMNFLQQKYQSLNLQIRATDGTMSEAELADHVKETLRQLGINPEKAIVKK
jgi:hypothetical protein